MQYSQRILVNRKKSSRHICMALNGLLCAYAPLRNYLLTFWWWLLIVCVILWQGAFHECTDRSKMTAEECRWVRGLFAVCYTTSISHHNTRSSSSSNSSSSNCSSRRHSCSRGGDLNIYGSRNISLVLLLKSWVWNDTSPNQFSFYSRQNDPRTT